MSTAKAAAAPLPLNGGAELAQWRSRHNPWLIAITVTMATFMEVLDTSIANVALPHIAGNLSASVDESTWVLTSYLVTNAIVLPLSGWLSSIIGRKRFYMSCVAIFTVSSAMCGLAPTLGMLVFFRIIQGLGGGGLQPSEQAILADTFPPNKRAMAFALYGLAVVTAPALGPTLGGWITDHYTWRWIFFINIPVGLLSMFLTQRMVEDPPHLRPRGLRAAIKGGMKIDYIGLGLIAVGLGALQIALDKGQREDWFESHLIVWMTVIFAVGLVGAIVWELRVKDPIVDLRLLKDRNFATAVTLMFLLGFVLMGSTVLLPLYLQTMMGYTAQLAGEALSPGGIVIMLAMPLVAFLLGRFQPRSMVAFGFAVGAMGLFLMGGFNLNVDFKTAMYARVVQGLGMAFMFVPINTGAYFYLPREKNNNASGLINLARNIGGSVGIAFVMTLIAQHQQSHQNFLVSHVTPYDFAYNSTMTATTQALTRAGMPAVQASQAALGSIYGTVQRQAMMMSFVDAFRIMGCIFVVMIPLAFMMKKIKVGKAAPSVH